MNYSKAKQLDKPASCLSRKSEGIVFLKGHVHFFRRRANFEVRILIVQYTSCYTRTLIVLFIHKLLIYTCMEKFIHSFTKVPTVEG